MNIALITNDKEKGLRIVANLEKKDVTKTKVIMDEIVLGIFNKHKLTPVEALFISEYLHKKMNEAVAISVFQMGLSASSLGSKK